MSRNVLLHCHFFKNAGSSIDWALRRKFKESFYENKKHFYSIEEWNENFSRILIDESIKVVSSHIFSLMHPKLDNININTISMCRHPLERVTSVAAFEKKQRYKNSLGTITDTEIGIRDYVKAYLKEGTPASIRNIHTLRFAGRDNGNLATELDFNMATSTAKKSLVVGMVEYFDESMVLFEEFLKPIFPSLDLAYITQNVYQKPATIEQRVSALQVELGNEIFEDLCRKNEMDLKLYEIVKSELFYKIESVQGFSAKLADFRERCESLAK